MELMVGLWSEGWTRAVDRFSRARRGIYPSRKAESLAASCSRVYKLFESGAYDSPFFASLISELPGDQDRSS